MTRSLYFLCGTSKNLSTTSTEFNTYVSNSCNLSRSRNRRGSVDGSIAIITSSGGNGCIQTISRIAK